MPPVLQVLHDLVRWDPNPVMTSNNLIFDVGLHTGQDTAFYLKKGFRVIAIEANPLLAPARRDPISGVPDYNAVVEVFVEE